MEAQPRERGTISVIDDDGPLMGPKTPPSNSAGTSHSKLRSSLTPREKARAESVELIPDAGEGIDAGSDSRGRDLVEVSADNLMPPPPLPEKMPPLGDSEDPATPIDWPAVLELARASNLEIRLAQEKITEACGMLHLARLQWFPSLHVGGTWMHHEGRIQDIPGQVFDASKSSIQGGGLLSANFEPSKVIVDTLRARQQVRARRGELDRTTRQTIQESSLAYVDLVASQGATAIAGEVFLLFKDLDDRAKDLLEGGFVAKRDTLDNAMRLTETESMLLSAREMQLKAGARLANLLNLPAGTRLISAEKDLVPVPLVPEQVPDEMLLAQARRQGPGLSEVAALLEALDEQQRQARRIALIPNVQASAGGGWLGGGPGGSYGAFADQGDFRVGVNWDVLRMMGGGKIQEVFDSKRRQANLEYDKLLLKLGTGVIVFRLESRNAWQRIKLSEKQIEMAVRNYRLCRDALQIAPISSPPAGAQQQASQQNSALLNGRVQQAIADLAKARRNYLEAVISYNKAQIQLQYLIGFDNVLPLDPPADGVEIIDETAPAPGKRPAADPNKTAPANPPAAPKSDGAPGKLPTASRDTFRDPSVAPARLTRPIDGQAAPSRGEASRPRSASPAAVRGTAPEKAIAPHDSHPAAQPNGVFPTRFQRKLAELRAADDDDNADDDGATVKVSTAASRNAADDEIRRLHPSVLDILANQPASLSEPKPKPSGTASVPTPNAEPGRAETTKGRVIQATRRAEEPRADAGVLKTDAERIDLPADGEVTEAALAPTAPRVSAARSLIVETKTDEGRSAPAGKASVRSRSWTPDTSGFKAGSYDGLQQRSK
jgi:outer membrane protein TolC